MRGINRLAGLAAALLLAATGAHAQAWEALVPFKGVSSSAATAAVDDMFSDPAAYAQALDELFASDAFRTFERKVRGIREIVRVSSYRRLGAWGY